VRINAIWYPVKQWAEAKRFYGELLGLPLTACSDEAGWAAFGTESGVPLFLVLKPERAGIPGGAVVTFHSTDLAVLASRLTLAGFTVTDQFQAGESVRVLTTYDPDGNMVEISEPA
jgi:predicted enzyme related to lactoylglutathione lyase